MERIPTHPAILRTERTGYPFRGSYPIGHCEICGEQIYDGDNFLVYDFLNNILVCDCCREDDEALMELDYETEGF